MARPFDRLDLPPAYKAVSAEIERRILAGALKPGDRLPSETALAGQFGVNRSTVREGIRQLEQEGLVRREGGRRLFVALPGHGELAPRATRALIMHQATFRELWHVALSLEPTAAALAAGEAAAGHAGEAMSALERNVARTGDLVAAGTAPSRDLVALDIEFHALVALAARNRALMLAREPVGLLFYPAIGVLLARLPQAGRRLVQAHRAVLEALRTGDAAGAERWMRKHIVDFRRGYEVARLSMDHPVGTPRPDRETDQEESP